MSRSDQKIVQYLNEAHATEVGLVRVLQSQIAMTPRGTYRSALERHRDETREHAQRLRNRLAELDQGRNPIQFLVGVAETAISQVLALGKTPLDLIRGSGGEEKVLRNARDAAATEALEIATYLALERLARKLGDERTADLAASIRADEERMFERIKREIPKLTDAVVSADVKGEPTYDLSETGAADALREAGDTARRTARQARRVPGVARAEGTVKGALADESDLPVANYDGLTADEIVARLPGLSQVDLAKVEAYETRDQSRTTVLSRIESLRGDEPWPGYDEQTVSEIQPALARADEDLVRRVRAYERAHKNRAGVIQATERATANA